MSTKERFLELAKRPGITVAEVAFDLQVSRQRVHQLCKTHGIKLQRATHRSEREPKSPYRWGGERRIPPNWVGAAGELTAAVELIKMGFYVHQAVARTGPFDLVAYSRGKFHRIEVRSIRQPGQRSIVKWADVDFLASVLPDGTIEWHPSVPEL